MRTRTVIGIVSALISLSFFVAPVANAAPLTTDQIGAIANLLKSFGADIKTIGNVANILLDSTSLIGLQSAHISPVTVVNPTTNGTATSDKTPRIMEWWGKVNQHVDTNGVWQTDPDGSSGANISALTYCKKWYPATVSVASYKPETISTWRVSGNTGAYTATIQSYKCIQPTTSPASTIVPSSITHLASVLPTGTATNDKTPRVMEWWGKVNQHTDASGTWQTDPDGSSGANLDLLSYCQKFYPSTYMVFPYPGNEETINTWRASGNVGTYTQTTRSYMCVLSSGSDSGYYYTQGSSNAENPVVVTVNASYPNQTIAPNTKNDVIGSYVITNHSSNTTEEIHLLGIGISTAGLLGDIPGTNVERCSTTSSTVNNCVTIDDLQNVHATYAYPMSSGSYEQTMPILSLIRDATNSSEDMTIGPPAPRTAANGNNPNGYILLAPGESVDIKVYADIGNTPQGAIQTALLAVNAVKYGIQVKNDPVIGQLITVASPVTTSYYWWQIQ